MSGNSSSKKHVGTVVVGAGPAGLQMGYFLEKANRDYLILESKDQAGSFYAKYPIHRFLLSINKNHNFYDEHEFNLRHDWNSLLCDDPELQFRNYSEDLYPSADDLHRYLVDFAEKNHLKIRYNTKVKSVGKAAGRFVIATQHGAAITCDRLLLGTGAIAPLIPEDIEGIEHSLGYEDCDLDLAPFENKRVAIIGRGNSAFEVANYLANSAALVHVLVAKPVKFAWQTHYVGDLRAINNTILDMYQLKSLHAALGFRLTRIVKNPDGTLRAEVEEDMPHWKTPCTAKATLTYDYIIRATGWKYSDLGMFEQSCVPALDAKGKYPQLSTMWETTVPGMHYIGAAMASLDRQSASGFIHGFRYNIRTLFHLLEEADHGVPLPSKSLPVRNLDDLDALAQFFIQRVSTTSALYQLNNFLCDAMVISDGELKLYYELGISYAKARFKDEDYLCLLTLEYGFQHYGNNAPTLDFIHPADAEDVKCAAFLHPVFRVYQKGEQVDEAILGESLVVRYDTFDYKENLLQTHVNTLKNLFNRKFKLTEAHFSEEKYPEGTIVKWSEEQIRSHRESEAALAGASAYRCKYR